VLLLGHNDIDGHIPKWIWDLPALEVLDLSNNKFSGPFAGNFSNLQAFMDSNQTTLSSSTSSMYALNIVMVVKNEELVFTTVLLTSISMDLSMNNLSGSIPSNIGELLSMVNLNLSSNELSGTIPASIGSSMTNLQSLDLSNNLLGGEIPQSFATLSQLSVLRLGSNNLTGRIPSSSQLQTQGADAFLPNNTGLCGAPLNRTCATSSTANSTSSSDESSDSSAFSDVFSVPGFLLGTAIGFVSFSTFFVLWEPARTFLHVNNLEKPTGAWNPRT
jgi:Leucine-rich repeat (LRR) protein